MVLYFKNRYGLIHLVLLIIIFVLYQLEGKAFAFFLHDNSRLMKILLSLISSYFLDLLLLLYIFLLMKKSSVSIKTELNISIKKIDVLWGGMAYLVSLLLISFILNYFLPIKSDESRVALKIKYLIMHSHYYIMIPLFVYGSILAPITEELVFRGFIWKIFEEKKFNRYLILLITSLFFALLHFESSMFASLFVLGLILGFLRMRTNRLGASIILHVVLNTFTILLTVAFYLFYS